MDKFLTSTGGATSPLFVTFALYLSERNLVCLLLAIVEMQLRGYTQKEDKVGRSVPRSGNAATSMWSQSKTRNLGIDR